MIAKDLRLALTLAVLAAIAGPSWAADTAPSPEARRLISLLDDQDLYVQQEAFMQLEMLREAATAPAIRAHLDSRSEETRAFSVRALAAVEGVRAVPTLVERLKKERDPQVRVSTLLALEPLQDPAVLPALIDRLRDRQRNVRMAAVDAVSRVKDPLAKAALQKRWVRERDRDVRRVLEKALARAEES